MPRADPVRNHAKPATAFLRLAPGTNGQSQRKLNLTPVISTAGNLSSRKLAIIGALFSPKLGF
jgi:hypothetical protein